MGEVLKSKLNSKKPVLKNPLPVLWVDEGEDVLDEDTELRFFNRKGQVFCFTVVKMIGSGCSGITLHRSEFRWVKKKR